MSFFQTMATGYSIMWNDFKLGWQMHGAQFLTGTGTGIMMIANALFARKAAMEDTRLMMEEAKAEAEKAKAEMNMPVIPEGTPEKEVKSIKRRGKIKYAKAQGNRVWVVAKRYWKEAAVSGVGAVCIGAGQHMNTVQKTALATAVAAVSTEFAAYRANVVDDLGAEKDLQYLTTKKIKGKSAVKGADMSKNGASEGENESENDGSVTVKTDPNAFKMFLSPETTPWICTDNWFLTSERIHAAERMIELIGWKNGVVSLNDMRRELGDPNNPRKADHPLGGIFGKRFKPYRADDGSIKYPHFKFGGYEDDAEFMAGQKTSVWVTFPCDLEPIINDINKKILSVEESRSL